ncbi:MAG: hypothetical protein ACPGVU_07770 [Limisphaerales bacterium]
MKNLARLLFVLAAVLLPPASRAQAPQTLFSTAFGTNENYDAGFELVGQHSWMGQGTAGNGLVTRFPGEGQQAYIGFFDPLTNTESSFTTWRPIAFDPIANGKPVVTFRTKMEIVDSTAADPNKDDFRWEVFNTEGLRLFSLDFDNSTMGICYLLEDAQFRVTPYSFLRNTVYDLEIKMDFENNVWLANFSGTIVISNQPIAQTAARRDLGDIAATWFFLTPNSPGNNAMVFDNYTITAESIPTQPTLQLLSVNNNQPLLQLTGEANRSYILEASTDLRSWFPIKTNTPNDGTFQHLDTGAVLGLRHYRARVR